MSFIFIPVRMMLHSKEIFIVRLLYYPHLVSSCLISPHLLFSNWPLLFTSPGSPPLRSSVSDAEIFCDIISVAIKIWLSVAGASHSPPRTRLSPWGQWQHDWVNIKTFWNSSKGVPWPIQTGSWLTRQPWKMSYSAKKRGCQLNLAPAAYDWLSIFPAYTN